MNNITNINDDYTSMFINEEKEDLLEGKTFYLEAKDGAVLCKYKKWNQNPTEKQVKWFGSYRGAKNFITKNHLGIVSIKDRDFTKRDFGEVEQQVTEAEQINSVKLEKILFKEFKNWSDLLKEKYGQNTNKVSKIINKIVNVRSNGIMSEAFSPNQNDGDVKVTMVFKGGKMVNWNFDGKPKTKDMLSITKQAPFIKNNLTYNKEKKVFMWKQTEKDNDEQKKQGQDKQQGNDQGNEKNKENTGLEQKLTEASINEWCWGKKKKKKNQ